MNKSISRLILFAILWPSLLWGVEPTPVGVADGLGGFFRDARKIETQNPDDFVVIPGDITIGGTTKLFGNISSTGLMSHNGNVFIHLSSNQNITIDGATHPREITDGVFDINHVSEIPSTRSINIDINANGQPNVKGQVINYTADQLGPEEIGQGLDVNIIAGTGLGGRVDAISVTKVGNAGLGVHAIHINPEVDPIHQISGGIADVQIAFLFDDSGASFTNVTTEFNSPSINIRIFDEEDDQVYIGNTLSFSEIAFSLATSATGAGIKPTFEYSDGASGWIAFSPTDDTTNGMKNSGAIVWVPGSLAGWATDTVNGVSGKFWIRITRTQGNLSQIPVESFVDIVEGVNFFWNKDGDLNLRDAIFRNVSTANLTVTDNIILKNYSGCFGVDGSGDAFSTPCGDGVLVQSVYKHYTASVSGSGNVTRTDDPVLGDETVLFMDITITPTSAENKIFVEGVGSLNSDNLGSVTFVSGIFTNNTALRVQESAIDNGQFSRTVSVFHSHSALTTDPITYQYRVGTAGGITAFMNSLFGSAEIYGNTLQSYIRAWEEVQ